MSRTQRRCMPSDLVGAERERRPSGETAPRPRRSRPECGSWRSAAAEGRSAGRARRPAAADASTRKRRAPGSRPRAATGAAPSAAGGREPAERGLGRRPIVPDPLELEPHVARRLPAIVGILGETGPHDAVERRRAHRRERRDRRRLLLHDRRDERGLEEPVKLSSPSPSRRARSPARRCPSARRSPCPRAARAPCTGRCRGSTLLRQVRRRRGHGGEPAGRRSASRNAARGRSRGASPRPRQHDVAGLQVAMDDALAVRPVERVRDVGP